MDQFEIIIYTEQKNTIHCSFHSLQLCRMHGRQKKRAPEKKYRLRAKAEPVMKRKDYSASAAGAGPKAIGVAPVMASLASRVMVTSSMLRVLNSAL